MTTYSATCGKCGDRWEITTDANGAYMAVHDLESQRLNHYCRVAVEERIASMTPEERAAQQKMMALMMEQQP